MPGHDAPSPLALDATLRRDIPLVFLGVGGFYLVLLVVTPWVAGPDLTAGLLVRWAVTAAVGLSGAFLFRQWPVPSGWSNHVVGALGILVVLNSLAAVEAAGPAFLFAIVVALLAFALFMLSWPWVAALSALAMAGWLWLARQAGGGPEWVPRSFNLLAFCVLAVVVQVMRVRLHRRLLALKEREADQVRREEELRRAKVLAEQRRRMVRRTAHELATPLTPILLEAHLLAQADLPPEQREQVEVLQRNLERLRQVVQRAIKAADEEGRVAEDEGMDLDGT